MNRTILSCVAALIAAVFLLSTTGECEASLFHATKKAVAKNIMSQGIKTSKLKHCSRFQDGFYGSRRKATCVLERPKGDAIVKFRESSHLRRNTIDLRNPTRGKVRSILRSARYDLRWKIRKKTITRSLARKLGREAARRGKAIEYRSVKNGWTNVFVPSSLIRKHPRAVRPERVYLKSRHSSAWP